MAVPGLLEQGARTRGARVYKPVCCSLGEFPEDMVAPVLSVRDPRPRFPYWLPQSNRHWQR